MEEFKKYLRTQIVNEEEAIKTNEKDPMRHTECGNNIALQRIAEHTQSFSIYTEVLRAYYRTGGE